MPVYIRRTLEEFPRSFYLCNANPDGNPHICPLCLNAYMTKRGMLSHLRKCCEKELGEPYANDLTLDEDFTLGDAVNNHYVEFDQIREYILSNELNTYSERTSEEIVAIVGSHLRAKGHTSYCIYDCAFYIYKYFFEITEEEWETYKNNKIRRLLYRI